jgi:hypothetical protein
MRTHRVLLAFALAGCSTATMQMPAELAGTSALAVEGRQGWKINERISFGSYVARDVDRSWTRGSDLRILSYTSSKRRQSYRFTLAEGGTDRYHADCESAFRERGAEVRGIEIEATNRTALECRIRSAADPADAWTMKLAEERERPFSGTLAGSASTLQVVGTNRVEGGVLPVEGASGYRFEQDGRAIAAVDVMNDGTVFLPAAADARRALIATAAAALLLHENLRETLER